jgi:hypothetical protein
LQERDNGKSVEHCRWFRGVITANGDDIMDVTFFSDDSWFYLPGYVNSQNSRHWSATNLYAINDTPLRDQKVGVRGRGKGGISRSRIIAPMFFDNTTNSEVHFEVIVYFII